MSKEKSKNFHLETWIDLMHFKYAKVYFDYDELAKVISRDSGVQVVAQDIWDYYEELVTEEELDKRILVQNLGVSYD